MKNPFSRIIALLFPALFGCSQPALYMGPPAELTVSGKVKDSVSSAEISNIRVSLLQGTNELAYRTVNGSFSLQAYSVIDGEKVILKATGDSYKSVSNVFSVGKVPMTTNIDLTMEKK